MTKRRSALELKNEEALLVLIAECAATEDCERADGNSIESLIDHDFRWDHFLKLAGYHQYLPAAYRFLCDIGKFDLLPQNVQIVLKDEYFLAQARFIKKELELVEIIKILRAGEIDPIVIKGIPQAYLLYKDPGVRVSKDIDILIDPSEVETASRILSEIGYSIYTWERTIEEYRDFHYHFIFTRGENMDSVIELHWNLVYPHMKQDVDMDLIQLNTVRTRIRDTEVRALSPEHALWYASIHLSYKWFLELRNLADLTRLALKLSEVEWYNTLKWASRTGTKREITISLNLCQNLFGGFLPPEISRMVKPGIWDRLIVTSTYYPRGLVWEWVPFNDTHSLMMMFSMMHGFGKKARFLYRMVFPDRWALSEIYINRLDYKGIRKVTCCFNGLYIMGKMLLLMSMLGVLIQTEALGENMLDPERHNEI